MPPASFQRVCFLDLSFPPFIGPTELTVLPADLAALMTGIAARQAGSTTAAIQGDLSYRAVDPRLFAPVDGAFNGPMAAAIIRWKEA